MYMNVEERKKLVANLLVKAKSTAVQEAALVKAEPNPTKEFILKHLRKYIISRFLLSADTQEDNIRELARMSLQKTMHLDPKMLRELDQATPCDHATSESTKKVLLLYSVQKDFEIHPDPESYAAVENVETLAELICRERGEKRGNG